MEPQDENLRVLNLSLYKIFLFISYYRLYVSKWKVLVAQSCPILCHPMDCSPPGSSVLGILQARTLEWVSMPSSRGSSPSRDQTWVFCIALGFFTTEPLEKPMVALFLFFFFFFKGNSILFSLVLVSIYIPTTPKCRRVPLSQHLQHLSLANFLVVAILIDVR